MWEAHEWYKIIISALAKYKLYQVLIGINSIELDIKIKYNISNISVTVNIEANGLRDTIAVMNICPVKEDNID